MDAILWALNFAWKIAVFVMVIAIIKKGPKTYIDMIGNVFSVIGMAAKFVCLKLKEIMIRSVNKERENLEDNDETDEPVRIKGHVV